MARGRKTILEMKAGGHDTQGHRDSAADGLDKTGAGGAEKTGSRPPGGFNESSASSTVGLIRTVRVLVERFWRKQLTLLVRQRHVAAA